MKYTISETPARPTKESIAALWSRSEGVTKEFVREQFKYKQAQWLKFYGTTSPEISDSATRKAIAAVCFDPEDFDDNAPLAGVDAETLEESLFGNDGAEEIVRSAVRPMAKGWTGVQVGNERFGPYREKIGDLPPMRQSATPHDLYRLLYLFRPKGLNFDDMYGCGLFAINSPCRRFGMSFYLNKYELAAYLFVQKDLAVRTRRAAQVIVTCGVPGTDNGIATSSAPANMWFEMIRIALTKEWSVYGGNDFRV